MKNNPDSSLFFVNNLMKKFNNQIRLLDHAIYLTKTIFQLAKEGKIQNTSEMIPNRDRLINIIKQLHQEIENSITELTPELKSRQINTGIANWKNKTSKSINYIIEIDQKILDYLNHNKKNIQKELSNIHRYSSAHKKYSINQLERS